MRMTARRLAPALVLALALPAVGGACSAPRAEPTGRSPAGGPSGVAGLHVLMINGGGEREQNFASHLSHIEQLLALLDASGVPRQRITILAGDGADPAPDLAVRASAPEGLDLLEDTWLAEWIEPPLAFQSSRVPGKELLPATRAQLGRVLAALRERLRPGETLLLYVTDHGTAENPRDPLENRITLWGRGESISVRQLRDLLQGLPPGVRVVALMSQCFSGGFARLYEVRGQAGLPGGLACGYFASTADRPAYGCYPENRGKDGIGHSFEFMEALAASGRFADAHLATLIEDATPDVPLRSSDVFLRERLAAAARAQKTDEARLTDALLREAWKDRKAWEPELRLIDRIGQAFGLPSPRLLSEIEEQDRGLGALHGRLETHGREWASTRAAAGQQNLERFLGAHPSWTGRLRPTALRGISAAVRRGLLAQLHRELAAFTEGDPSARQRLVALADRSAAAEGAGYRMEVRRAALLRMRAILTGVAGRVHLATRGRPEERAGLEQLRACEDLALPLPPDRRPAPRPRPAFPPLSDELKLAEEVLPAYMGIRFREVSPAAQRQLGLAPGASVVQVVVPDSPAEAAGLRPGDVVVGPPGRPFSAPLEIKAFTMLTRIGQPIELEVLRRDQRLTVKLTPGPFPDSLGPLGPPALSSAAPPVLGVPYRGAPPAVATQRGPFVLFFWATWCEPCKQALPELLAFERQRAIPIVAITDEPREALDPFFAAWRGPFPGHVLVDEARSTFMRYGVSGTPTFVLVDGQRKVAAHAAGYRRDRGLALPGWRWDGR